MPSPTLEAILVLSRQRYDVHFLDSTASIIIAVSRSSYREAIGQPISISHRSPTEDSFRLLSLSMLFYAASSRLSIAELDKELFDLSALLSGWSRFFHDIFAPAAPASRHAQQSSSYLHTPE
jgi:hypothetical protein